MITNKPQKRFFKPENKSNPEDFVFGIQSVNETLKSGKPIDKLLLAKDFSNPEIEKQAKINKVPVQRVPIEKLNRVTRKNHQGVIAFVSVVPFANLNHLVAGTFEKGEVPLILVLDRITDVRNFGAIARTAECLGVNGILVPSRESAQINSDAMKTSSGALNYIPVCREFDLYNALLELKNSGFQLVSASEKAEKNIDKVDFTIPTAIVMGSESDGVSESILSISDQVVKIPLIGNVESLNVSVATGMLLYEVQRQRLASE